MVAICPVTSLPPYLSFPNPAKSIKQCRCREGIPALLLFIRFCAANACFLHIPFSHLKFFRSNQHVQIYSIDEMASGADAAVSWCQKVNLYECRVFDIDFLTKKGSVCANNLGTKAFPNPLHQN
jgi:hypothetical protein